MFDDHAPRAVGERRRKLRLSIFASLIFRFGGDSHDPGQNPVSALSATTIRPSEPLLVLCTSTTPSTLSTTAKLSFLRILCSFNQPLPSIWQSRSPRPLYPSAFQPRTQTCLLSIPCTSRVSLELCIRRTPGKATSPGTLLFSIAGCFHSLVLRAGPCGKFYHSQQLCGCVIRHRVVFAIAHSFGAHHSL